MSGPCSMCQHFSMPERMDAKLRGQGWGICALGPDIAGHYMSQAAACQFKPSRYLEQPKVDEATDERAGIIAEGNGVDQSEGLRRARAGQPAPCDLPEEIDFG